MGIADPFPMDEKMANPGDVERDDANLLTSKSWLLYLIVALVAGAIYLGCAVSPPSLMDDVDASVTQISKNMLKSGDWVTPRINGVVFLEKPAMFYWPMALSFKILAFMTGRHGFPLHFPRSGWRV